MYNTQIQISAFPFDDDEMEMIVDARIVSNEPLNDKLGCRQDYMTLQTKDEVLSDIHELAEDLDDCHLDLKLENQRVSAIIDTNLSGEYSPPCLLTHMFHIHNTK